MRQLSTRNQMTQKLITIGHHAIFNNEQSPYRIVRYKNPRNCNIRSSTKDQYINNFIGIKQWGSTKPCYTISETNEKLNDLLNGK